MFRTIPEDPKVWMAWTWADFSPYVDELRAARLDAGTVEPWLVGWSRLEETIDEVYNRLYVASSADIADAQVEARYNAFLDEIFPQAMQVSQALKEKLLESGLEPAGMEMSLRKLRAEVDLYREANLPLLTEEQKLNTEFDKILGAQTVEWEGREVTIPQLRPILQDLDRTRRERAWRLGAERQLADREAINAVWQKELALRMQLAENAGRPDYRQYRWQQLLRFDYTPEDCQRFHQAIETVVVPAASRIYARRQQRLGVDSLRPWDLEVDAFLRPPLIAFQDVSVLKQKISAIFHQVDPHFGGYFDQMDRQALLDLENRKNKRPGAYCAYYARTRVPFIFRNAVGIHYDVNTLLHEGGHAFHDFEKSHLPYFPQMSVPAEFAEVASMSMELLSAPYLEAQKGGFYTPEEAARARVEHLETIVLFWPYMAVVDAFQHWVYTHPKQACDPSACDTQWGALWQRFMPGVDWSGLEDAMVTGWHRKHHIHTYPFYYVEYGLAQSGACQVWRNSLDDQGEAVAAYRRALALGGTVPLPRMYETAGARLAFDAGTLQPSVEQIEQTIDRLEAGARG